jgi:hypothetical protein
MNVKAEENMLTETLHLESKWLSYDVAYGKQH